jgi:hypothetical protein
MTPDIEHQTEPKSKDAVVGTRIVAGIDGSGASLGALRWAADQAERQTRPGISRPRER